MFGQNQMNNIGFGCEDYYAQDMQSYDMGIPMRDGWCGEQFDGWNGGTARGVYDMYSQFDFDPIRLGQLGFTQEEVQAMLMLVNYGQRVTVSTLTQCGIDYEKAKRIKYMHDICTGKVSIESEEQLIKHLKKMSAGKYKIGIGNLPVSKISEVPRKCLIGGFPDGIPFCIYNSNRWKKEEAMYNIESVSSERINFVTKRKPKLAYKDSMQLWRIRDLQQGKVKFTRTDGEIPKSIKEDTDRYEVEKVAEIKDVRADGTLLVSVHKDFAREVSRFIVVASTKRPEFHHGSVEIICVEGTKIYVFARTAQQGVDARYNIGTQRIYAYGYTGNEIQGKLMEAASEVYRYVCGCMATTIPANQDYKLLVPMRREVQAEDEVSERVRGHVNDMLHNYVDKRLELDAKIGYIGDIK